MLEKSNFVGDILLKKVANAEYYTTAPVKKQDIHKRQVLHTSPAILNLT